MKVKKVLFLIVTLVLISSGCSDNPDQHTDKSKTNTPETVTANVIFRASDKGNPISDITILLIKSDGKVIDELITNKQGEARKSITVPVDRRYSNTEELGARGTVTAIAFKDGYRETVLFEVPINDWSVQPFYMEPINPGERNEPSVQLGNNHHLEILSLVESYAPYAQNTK